MTQACYILALSKEDGMKLNLQSEGLATNESGEEVFLFGGLFGESTRDFANKRAAEEKAREFILTFGRRSGLFLCPGIKY